ncbi:hypothetical protein ABH944_000567 [Caballeronia udeis]|uniref:Peptidase S53 domain-containing protein n=1 Tax=Caballeronia udeis TaxID=1232866 RepID=A0ABW8MAH3_9BURK
MDVPANYNVLQGSARRARRGVTIAGPADPDEKLSVSVVVRRRADAPPLWDQDHWAKTPPGRRKFLSRPEFARTFGADLDDLERVASFGFAHELTVVESDSARRTVVLTGTVAQMSSAFAVELNMYRSPTETYRGREGAIYLPSDLVDLVEGVFGLDNRRMARHASGGPSGAVPLTPPQVAGLYGFPTTSAASQTVAILEFSGPTSNPSTPRSGFSTSDVASFLSSVHVTPSSTRTIKSVTVDPSPTSPGNSPFYNASTFASYPPDPDVEVALDVEIVASVTPDSNIAVYFAPFTEQGWVDAINQIVADHTNDPSVLSISYGWPELEADQLLNYPAPPGPYPWPFEWTQAAANALTTAFQSAAMIGMTVFVSSGDHGSDCGEQDGKAHVLYPASDPWVTTCGGTTITSTSPLTQITWNDNSGNDDLSAYPNYVGDATGGGISYLWGAQPWQENANVPLSKNGDGRQGRGIPDVAGNASAYSGYTLWLYGQSANDLAYTDIPQTLGTIGGTSAVAPLYAALLAIINAALPERVGYLNPTLYAIGSTLGQNVFVDIADGASNAVYWVNEDESAGGPSPGYASVTGWDACTGWGTINGSALLAFFQQLFQRSLTINLERSTYGQNEALQNDGVFAGALFVVVDGLKASEFPGGGITQLITTLTPSAAQLALLAAWAPSIPAPAGTGIVFTPTGVDSDDPSLGPEVQRFTFTYQVQIPQSAFTTPGVTYPELLTITASLPIATNPPSPGSSQIELITAADPFFSDEANGGSAILSEDLRAFYVEEGQTMFGMKLGSSQAPTPLTFIQKVVTNMSGVNGTVPGDSVDSFESLPHAPNTDTQLSVFPTTTGGTKVYNFALARVRLTGTGPTEGATKVRVFFRTWQAQSTAITYTTPAAGSGASPSTGSFRQYTDPPGTANGVKVPLLGISGNEYTTVPYFATPRVSPGVDMTTQPEDAPFNAKGIVPPAAGGTTYAYFGAWLDTNLTTGQFPLQPPPANPDGENGGFNGLSLVPITKLFRGLHQCLVAEIVDDEAPIITGATPGSSDKLAQRNIAFVPVANPGVVDSRLATHTFEIQPSPAVLGASDLPDELMIDWGQIPKGSVASLYLPAVDAADVLALAAKMYTFHDLSASDAHTLVCPTGGITYVPIPPGSGSGVNLAGLFSVELPSGITKGQAFEIVVRQVKSASARARTPPPPPPPSVLQFASASVGTSTVLTWRRICGAFRITIPVSTKGNMLVPAERALSLMRWVGETIPPTDRWYPVFVRYIGQLAGRVAGLGGDPNTVPPTGTGIWPGGLGGGQPVGGGHGGPGDGDVVGKIEGLIYDHFGDFEGFLLETERGESFTFYSRESFVEDIACRAWTDRLRVTVILENGHDDRPRRIILHPPHHPQ